MFLPVGMYPVLRMSIPNRVLPEADVGHVPLAGGAILAAWDKAKKHEQITS
jgi:hypothetical protein